MSKTCIHCEREATARGLCLRHYKIARNSGTLDQYNLQVGTKAHNRLDLVGIRFGKLVVTGLDGIKPFQSGSKTVWKCMCDCGCEVSVYGSSLTHKLRGIKSCGCNRMLSIRKTHGMTETRVYRIWQAMRTRCRNANVMNYEIYGGRGIKICERWDSFENFIADMGEPPADYSIDRINNDGDYSPENCRWASRKEQARNKSTNRMITLNGETKPLIEWAEQIGIEQSSLRERLAKWPLEAALTTHRKG